MVIHPKVKFRIFLIKLFIWDFQGDCVKNHKLLNNIGFIRMSTMYNWHVLEENE